MTLLPRLCLVLAFAGLVAGCQAGSTSPGAGDVVPNAVAGDPIEVTALDAPPPATPAAAEALTTDAAQVDGAAVAETAVPAVGTGSDTSAVEAATTPTDAAEAAPDAQEAPPEVVEAAPPPPKSERQIACERKRGTWIDTGGGLKACSIPTRDSGKRCTRESQCESVCLARSQTCAPVKPLFGCNEVLQENGTRATLCIE